MVDFNKLRNREKKTKIVDPIEIFRRLPKPTGINDLYTSQAEVLNGWFKRRTERDIVIKLHTGGGKTLVGLLIAQSTLNEISEPVLYLTTTNQLVKQTIEKANETGIAVVPYSKGQPLNEDFVNGRAIMVATYKALFNGQSKFGLRGKSHIQKASAIILDDAHAAFSVIRESFTLDVKSNTERSRYESLCGLFRKAFKDTDRIGLFDDILSEREVGSVIEVPYWAMHEQVDTIREQLKSDIDKYSFTWPLLRDNIHLCHALISSKAFTLTPILPFVNYFPTFYEADRRIYISATIADDSDIVRTFDANQKPVQNALTSRSLAGVSERMILIPDLMPFRFKSHNVIEKLITWTKEQKLGSVILVSSDRAAEQWSDVPSVVIAKGSQEVEKLVAGLQKKTTYGPVVFSNRYDGIDLPGDSCRLLIMSGLPAGTSNYELFRASALYGGATITRMLAQRIEQGIGRGSRGSGDHCAVILTGKDLASWIAKDTNFKFLTSATKAQLKMGEKISKAIIDEDDLQQTIKRSYGRDKSWVEYHAETLADLVDENVNSDLNFIEATTEREALNLWQDGHHEKAIKKIRKTISENENLDNQTLGWLEQFCARIADNWGQYDLSDDLQQSAFAHNRNLIRPKILPPYLPLTTPGPQAQNIVKQFGGYQQRRGFLSSFETVVADLHENASANQFEAALANLGKMVGFSSQRHDNNGEGPDVLWLLPDKIGFVIEAKSRKNKKNALRKEEHGQLLVASEWFAKHYKGYRCVRVCVHKNNFATKAADACASYALTFEKLIALVSDAKVLLSNLSESQLPQKEFLVECEKLVSKSTFRTECFIENYLVHFIERE